VGLIDLSRPVRFAEHAERQRIERSITRAEALFVLRHPHTIEASRLGRHNVSGRTAEGRGLRVTIDLRTNSVVTIAVATGVA
jgi:hypothetical protein